jgi:hypothetical protein
MTTTKLTTAWKKYQRSEKREERTAVTKLQALQVAERRALRETHKQRRTIDSVKSDKAELAQRHSRERQHLEETCRNKQRAQSLTHYPQWIPNPPFGAWLLGDRRSLDYWRKFVKGLPETEFVAWLSGNPDSYAHAGRIAFIKKRIIQIQQGPKTGLQDRLQKLESPRKPGPVPKAVDPAEKQALADAKQLHQTLTMQFNAVEAPFGNAERVDLGELCKQLLPNVTPEELREVVILPSDKVTTSRKTAMLVSKQTGIPIERFYVERSPKTSTKQPRRKRNVPFDENRQ